MRSLIIRTLLVAVLLVPLAAPLPAVAYQLDAFESGTGDDAPAAARDITTLLDYTGASGWFGEPMSTENHTIDTVNDGTQTSDEDWLKFTVTTDDLNAAAVSYIIEAVAGGTNVDPVIELYGPAASAAAVTRTSPGSLPPDAANPTFTATDPLAVAANDDGPFFALRSGSLSFIPSSAGTYYVRIRPYYQHDSGTLDPGFWGGEGPYTLRFKTGQLTRLAGATRIDTAVGISQERFGSEPPFSGAVVLANGFGFADALSGSTLAGVLGCPVLLTPTDTLPLAVANEIKRLDAAYRQQYPTAGPFKVYILGGTAAVSAAVQNAVAALPATPIRIPGTTRTDTARRVAVEASKIASTAPVAFLANSRNFPDALAASPMAAFNGAPVLLTPGNELDPQVAAALADPTLGITDVVIVGGTAVVSPAVATQVATLLGGSDHVLRIAGASRYETARDFAVWATGVSSDVSNVGTIANPDALVTLDFARIGVASGENFPDALAGGVFCGLARSPILLTRPGSVSPYLMTDEYTKALETDPTTVPPGQDYWFASNLAILRSYVFGGTSAVSNSVLLLLDVFSGPAF